MFVASMSFFAKIADPTMAGTYMTLYNGEIQTFPPSVNEGKSQTNL
jgi:hypothetical protein